jgi:hypothetical protein
MIDTAEGCGNVEVAIDRAPAKEIRQARAVDPENTRTLLELVRKNSEPPYRRNRCGFAAILKGKKQIMLLALRALWESEAPPPPFIPIASGVAVIYQFGPGWAHNAPGGCGPRHRFALKWMFQQLRT